MSSIMSSVSRRLNAELKTGGLPSYTSILAAVTMIAFFAILAYILIKCVSVINSKRMDARIKKAMQKRRNTNDKFRLLNGYSWDYVMAFHVFDDEENITTEQRTWNLKRVLAQLASGGLQIRLFYNTMHNVVYCKIRASQMRLMKEAVRTGLRLQLDETALGEYCRAGQPNLGWGPVEIPEKSDVTNIGPYKHMSCDYRMNEDNTGTHNVLKHLYRKWPVQQMAKVDGDTNGPMHFSVPAGSDASKETNYVTEVDGDIVSLSTKDHNAPLCTDSEGFQVLKHDSLLRSVDRLKLIDSIINNNTMGGCHLNTNLLLKHGCVLSYAPLHDYVALSQLQFNWVLLIQLPWRQGTEQVKDYFGERIGLYFAWLGLYTSWLIIASIAGMVAWSFVQSEGNNPNSFILPYFAGFMAIWGTLFLESWKRKEKRLAMEWCMDGVNKEEQDRPEFSGLKARSPVTGQEIVYFPQHMRQKRVWKSYAMVCSSLSVVIGSVALLFFIRALLRYKPALSAYAAEITSLLIALQIEFLNYTFNRVAIALNDNENHRSDSEYEDALISKAFIFQFLNSFSSLFYVSFIKPFYLADKCQPSGNPNCFYELQATLGTIFMSRMFIHNSFKLIKPLLETRSKLRETLKVDTQNTEEAKRHEVSEVEQMFMLPEFDALMGTFNDYASMVAQFGYMTMFVAAFPLCTVLAFTNNYVQMRVDAWRLCQVVQRPDPKSAESIGSWQRVMELIGLISVFTNSGLVSFTGSFAVGYSWPWRIWIFFLMSCFIISIKWIVMAIIPDIPYEVIVQEQRNTYVNEKVVHNKKDVLDQMDASTLRVRPNFRVNIKDDDPL